MKAANTTLRIQYNRIDWIEYNRIDRSKRVDIRKTDDLHRCIIWSLLLLSWHKFRFYPKVCNGCHYLMQKKSFNNVGTVSIKGNDYRIYFFEYE